MRPKNNNNNIVDGRMRDKMGKFMGTVVVPSHFPHKCQTNAIKSPVECLIQFSVQPLIFLSESTFK